jgi:hypothetical protein
VNRGIGRTLVKARRGAKRVYAGTRQPLAHPDGRVTPPILDVTNAAQIQAAVEAVGPSTFSSTTPAWHATTTSATGPRSSSTSPSTSSALRRHPGLPAVADTFSGSHRQRTVGAGFCIVVRHSSPPHLQGRRVLAVAIAACASCRTGRNRSCRPEPPCRHGHVPRPRLPKASPESVVRAIFDGVEIGKEEIFPDALSRTMADSWHGGVAKAMERHNASLLAAEPAAS